MWPVIVVPCAVRSEGTARIAFVLVWATSFAVAIVGLVKFPRVYVLVFGALMSVGFASTPVRALRRSLRARRQRRG